MYEDKEKKSGESKDKEASYSDKKGSYSSIHEMEKHCGSKEPRNAME